MPHKWKELESTDIFPPGLLFTSMNAIGQYSISHPGTFWTCTICKTVLYSFAQPSDDTLIPYGEIPTTCEEFIVSGVMDS